MKKYTESEIKSNLEKLEGWEYLDNAIETTFEFTDFKDTFSVMSRIAFEAEALSHHPDWTNVYNKLTIRLSTHDAGGITEKDFELAQVIENIIQSE